MAEESARNDHYSCGNWVPENGPLKVMVIGAHPDDADVHCGGTAVKLAAKGARVVFVSMTNGNKGHHANTSEELGKRRYLETQAAAKEFGIEQYIVLDHDDCELVPTLENRRELTRIVRKFGPHVIFTHRGNDYHADHRATAQLVMDVTYLLGVPLWCPDVPIPAEKPCVYYLRDAFRKPLEMTPDLVVALNDEMRSRLIAGLSCHVSQFFEWLPFDMGINPAEVPSRDDKAAVREFIEKHWVLPRAAFDARRFNLDCEYAEVFELSEYGREPSAEEKEFLGA